MFCGIIFLPVLCLAKTAHRSYFSLEWWSGDQGVDRSRVPCKQTWLRGWHRKLFNCEVFWHGSYLHGWHNLFGLRKNEIFPGGHGYLTILVARNRQLLLLLLNGPRVEVDFLTLGPSWGWDMARPGWKHGTAKMFHSTALQVSRPTAWLAYGVVFGCLWCNSWRNSSVKQCVNFGQAMSSLSIL